MLAAVAAPALVLSLAACTSQQVASPEIVDVSADPTPTPVATDASLGPIAEDTALVLTTTATAASGATMDLELRVRRSIPFDDVAGQTIPAAVLAACPNTLTPTTMATESWSFTRINVAATTTGGGTGWNPADVITLVPSGADAPIAAMSLLTSVAGSGEDCRLDKVLTAPGVGAVAFGTAGDTKELSAGGFTAWASQRFGFTAGAGVTLSDCTFEVLPLGEEFGGGAAWTTSADGSSCVAAH